MEVGAKIDMLTHIYSSNKNVLDKKHHIEAASMSLVNIMTPLHIDKRRQSPYSLCLVVATVYVLRLFITLFYLFSYSWQHIIYKRLRLVF